jgi:hypothetical protein
MKTHADFVREREDEKTALEAILWSQQIIRSAAQRSPFEDAMMGGFGPFFCETKIERTKLVWKDGVGFVRVKDRPRYVYESWPDGRRKKHSERWPPSKTSP